MWPREIRQNMTCKLRLQPAASVCSRMRLIITGATVSVNLALDLIDYTQTGWPVSTQIQEIGLVVVQHCSHSQRAGGTLCPVCPGPIHLLPPNNFSSPILFFCTITFSPFFYQLHFLHWGWGERETEDMLGESVNVCVCMSERRVKSGDNTNPPPPPRL